MNFKDTKEAVRTRNDVYLVMMPENFVDSEVSKEVYLQLSSQTIRQISRQIPLAIYNWLTGGGVLLI